MIPPVTVSMMPFAPRMLVFVLVLTAAVAGRDTAAHAHAVVLETLPADGAVAEKAPGHLLVRFNEPVTPISAQILDAEGRDVTPPDAASVSDTELRIALPPALAKGSYIASYRVVSLDSHPVGGSFVFSVGEVSARVRPQAPLADDTGWRLAMAAIRTVSHIGLLGGAGGVLFLLLVLPAGGLDDPTRRIPATLAGVGGLAALLAIGVQGGLLVGGPASILAHAPTWWIGAASGLGRTALTALLGLMLVVLGLGLQRFRSVHLLATLGAAAALASFALSGHVVTAGPRWFTVPVLIAHTAAVAFWVGSLAPLYQIVNRPGGDAALILWRFSRIAVAAVVVLVLAGLAIAVLQVRSFTGLVSTSYGLFLLVKIGLVAGLLTFAALNKLLLTPALASGKGRAQRNLRRSIAAEIALVLGILSATAALGTTPPPRVLAGGSEDHAGHMRDEPAEALVITVIGSGRSAEVVLSSARSGFNTARIRLLDHAGAPLEAKEVTLIAANPSAGVEPIRRAAEARGAGQWRVDDLLLVPAGEWTVEIEVLISDFEKASFDAAVHLP